MEEDLTRKIHGVLAALISVGLVGTLGYWWIEGWPAFDSFYMTVITLTTIGFGEVHDLSKAGRAFTILLSLGGLGLFAYAFSTLTAFFIEGRLSETLRRRRTRMKIKDMKEHYIVCGGGSTGTTVCEELDKLALRFVVVDQNPEIAEKAVERQWLVVTGNALKDDVLMSAGIDRAKGIFCVLHDDPSNVFVSLTARVLNPKIHILSELHNDDARAQLERSGADGIVNSGYIGGLRMVSQMIRPAAVSFLDAMIRDRKSDYRFGEIPVPKEAQGRTIREISPAAKKGALVLSVQDPETKEFRINPSRDSKLLAGETLIVLGNAGEIKEMKGKLRSLS